MRDRLIELIQNAVGGCARHWAKIIADHLLANGVIVPPCKVGDFVYMPWTYNGVKGIAFFKVKHIIISTTRSYVKTDFCTDDEGFWEKYNGGEFTFEDFGKTVFLNK